MKRIIPILALVMTLGVFGAAFATQGEDQCSVSSGCPDQTLTQTITVKVPTVLKYVFDNNVNQKGLPSWSINVKSAANFNVDNCYVVPNWVSDVQGFVQNNWGHLLPAKAAFGYPPIILEKDGQTVATWQWVAQHPTFVAGDSSFTLGSGYTSGGSVHYLARAKGNLVCHNQYAFELYSNCPTAKLRYSLSGADNGGFGTLYFEDMITKNGISSSTWHVTKGFALTTADGTQHPLLGSVEPGVFYDNAVNQFLWLKNSSASPSGGYQLSSVFTLGAP